MNEDLITRLLAQDGIAFEEMVREYTPQIYAVAMSMLGNEHDAKDASQDTFIKIFKALPQFRAASSLRTWIYRIAVNVCHDMLRQKQHHTAVSLEADDAFLQIADTGASPEEISLIAERQRFLRLAITSLPQEYRLAIFLRDIKGFSYAETAEILKVPLNTAKSRISRARNLLLKRVLKNRELFGELNGLSSKEDYKA